MNIKICVDNRKKLENNIALIDQLIISKIFPKKIGIRCVKYLIYKYEKYSSKNINDIKYMYLEFICQLMNLLCSFIYNYQKERLNNEFNEEVNNIIKTLSNIKDDKNNNDIPGYSRHLLTSLIKKANNKWELEDYVKKQYISNLTLVNKGKNDINCDNINKSFNDSSFIKEEEYDKSFVEENEENEIDDNKNNNKITFNDDIEREEDKKAGSYYSNKYKTDSNYKFNKYKNNNNYNINDWKNNNGNNTEYKSANNLSYNKNKTNYYNSNSNSNLNNINNNYKYNNTNRVNNNNNYYKYNSTTISSNNLNNLNNNNNYYKKFNSNSNTNLSNPSNIDNLYNNNISNNQKIILNNLKLFKRHVDNKKYIDKFNWDEIHNMIVYDKIGMNDFVEELVRACLSFYINKQSIYYIDLYVKAIFDYYKDYFDVNDVHDIKNTIVKSLENLYSEQKINYYLEDVWTTVLYYLIDNQILTISDFNIFNRDSNNIKKEIANILTKIIDYNRDTKKILISELKLTKFYNDYRKLFEKY